MGSRWSKAACGKFPPAAHNQKKNFFSLLAPHQLLARLWQGKSRRQILSAAVLK